MKTFSTCFAALVLAAAAWPAHADPTSEQRTQVENCKIMSGAVFQFAKARDRKQSKMDAFKDVTHGQTYVPGSLLDETLQWAYAHPDEQPDTASGHFYGRCVMDAYDARNPDTEGELDLAAQACQQGHPGSPADIRDCIEDKAQDIITRIQTQNALAASGAPAPAAPAAATVAQTAPANLVAVTAPPVQAPTPSQPAATTTPPAPVAKSAVEAPAPMVVSPQTVAVAPSLPAAMPSAAAAPAAPVAAPTPTAPVVPAAPAPQAVVAVAPAPPPMIPASAPQTPAAPSAPVAVQAPVVVHTPAPAPAVAEAAAPTPTPPPLPAPVTPTASLPMKAASSAPMVAKAVTPQTAAALPPLPSAPAPAPSQVMAPPPNLAGFGKLSIGMPMEEAYKAMGSHGDMDRDQQGEVHTYMIGDDHGFIEIRPSSTGTLYSIRVVGGADAQVAPILNVVLGDGAFVLINNVGMPSSRTPLPGDKELWNYAGRNYAFEISPGGDVIGVRIIDTGSDTTATQ